MRAYGVKRGDRGCCPGHDKFPRDTYRSRRSKKARAKANRLAHKRARAWARAEDQATHHDGPSPGDAPGACGRRRAGEDTP